jgi:hypothetical protein
MAAKMIIKGLPTEKDIGWFVKNIGPRTHWLPNSIGGKGWRFEVKDGAWWLTMDDDKMLTYYLLVK